MRFHRALASAALVVCSSLVAVAVPAASEATSAQLPLPQPTSAQAGATWLADQLTPQGYIPSQTDPGTADLSATANAVLALASANVDPAGAAAALSYLEANVDAYVSQDGADGPGQLALLMLDAQALDVSPTSFGGTNLVTRLLATEQATGTDAGLFGTESQVNDYLAGVYDQGLALAALAGAGVTTGTAITAADKWLLDQQCPDGGWTSYEADNPCNGSPADYAGPDTNSTALAIQGLAAQDDLGAAHAEAALRFLVDAQDSDGGWGYEPNAASAPGSTDPDSTALVLQAILALGKSPNDPAFNENANPVAVLESFQTMSGSSSGSFSYPGISGPNILSTYQAVPALAGAVFPFNLYVTTTSLPTGSLHNAYSATLSATGGNPPYRWQVEGGFGTLPPGLTLHPATGVISGKPTANGTFSFVVVVTDTKTPSPSHDHMGWSLLSIST